MEAAVAKTSTVRALARGVMREAHDYVIYDGAMDTAPRRYVRSAYDDAWLRQRR